MDDLTNLDDFNLDDFNLDLNLNLPSTCICVEFGLKVRHVLSTKKAIFLSNDLSRDHPGRTARRVQAYNLHF